MLRNQSRSSLTVARTRLPASPNTTQIRHFWPFGKRRSYDWTTRTDINYLRYNRQRFLMTKAKLLQNARRRAKWDWDGTRGSFFTPRHVRLASHYYGNGRGSRANWQKDAEQEDGKQEQDDVELSPREKIWRQQMDRMRKRVEDDPYEAIFGRRFEPFWSPLMPSWIRENCQSANPSRRPDYKKEHPSSNNVADTKTSIKESNKPKVTFTEAADATKKSSPQEYAYSSSTSWNSWTNTTKKTEWDSLSNETRRYEYDPVSGRMVELESQTLPKTEEIPASGGKTEAIDAAVENKDVRKSIPIPQYAAGVNLPDAVNLTSPDSELAKLTAKDIRASIGRRQAAVSLEQTIQNATVVAEALRSTVWHDTKELYRVLVQELISLRKRREALLKERGRAFNFDGLAKENDKLDTQISNITTKVEAMNKQWTEKLRDAEQASFSHVETTVSIEKNRPLQSAIDRMQSKSLPEIAELDDAAAHESTGSTASSLPADWSHQAELLQSDRVKRTAARVPFSSAPRWVDDIIAKEKSAKEDTNAQQKAVKLAKANEMLAAEVDRHKLVMKLHEERYKDAVRGLQANLEAKKPSHDEIKSGLEQQIQDLQNAETKYKTKIAALKQELDIAYKQSSRHADEFRDRIAKTEGRNTELEQLTEKYNKKLKAMKENLDIAYRRSSIHADEFRKQIQDANALAQKSGKSATDAFNDSLQMQIDTLKAELGKNQKPRTSKKADLMMRGEGDVCPNVKDFAGSNKWYKQPAVPVKQMTKQASALRDHALVKEIRELCEASPSTSQAGAATSVDTRLGRSLKALDKQRCYGFHEDGLEKELCEQATTSPSHEKQSAYEFKADNLEAELKKTDDETLIKDKTTGVYRFCDDGLEAELTKKTPAASAHPTELDKKKYGFKQDGLEAELASTPDAKTTQNNRISLRQSLAADFKDLRRMMREVSKGEPVKDVNPVDGTSGAPAVERYASPTGFVNLDPLPAYDNKNDSKVRREEAVFSGTRRVQGSRAYLKRSAHRRRAWRRFMLASIVIVGTLGGSAYIQGAALERNEQSLLRLAREYEKMGEPRLAKAVNEIQQADAKRSSGLFWK